MHLNHEYFWLDLTTMMLIIHFSVPSEQGCLDAVLARQGEVDGLSSLAQQVLEETYISSRVSVTATQLTARYHSLLLNIQVRRSLLSAVQWFILYTISLLCWVSQMLPLFKNIPILWLFSERFSSSKIWISCFVINVSVCVLVYRRIQICM